MSEFDKKFKYGQNVIAFAFVYKYYHSLFAALLGKIVNFRSYQHADVTLGDWISLIARAKTIKIKLWYLRLGVVSA